MKHTPGPWTITPDEVRINQTKMQVLEISSEEMPYWIAYVQSSKPYTDYKGDSKANANLIAAAPDMYEALKKAEFAIMQVPAMSEGVSGILRRAAAEVEKALAKAEGRE